MGTGKLAQSKGKILNLLPIADGFKVKTATIEGSLARLVKQYNN